MRILLNKRDPTVLEALLVYLSFLFLWHLVLSFFFPGFENLDLLKYGAAAASMYWIAKITSPMAFLGVRLRRGDVPEIIFLYALAVLMGVSCGAILIFLDASFNGQLAAQQRWSFISRNAFHELEWSIPWLVGRFFLISFLGPIAEEIVFRGFILARLRERYGLIFSVIASSALFGAVHFNKSFIGAFVLGLIYAVLAIRTSSLYAAMLVHGLYNATVFLLMVCFGVPLVGDTAMLSNFSYWIPEFLCGAVGLALLAIYFFVWPGRRTQR